MSRIIFQGMTIWFPFSVTIRKEEDSYISICPEADIICRGKTIEEATENLKKEVEKFLGEELPQGFSKIVYY
jgi:predicted RNase H-like HicB family nuclease